MRKRRVLLGALATVLSIILAACTSEAGSSPSSATIASGFPASSPSGLPTPSASVGSVPGGSADLQLQQEFVSVVQNVSPSVVVIQTDQGLGSGIIFDDQGHVVTNAHVTDGAASFQVTLADGRQQAASLVGSFPQDDLAVLAMGSPPADLHPATFADSTKLQVGDIVMAIGNPLGLQSSVTEGIVSALNRTVSEPGGVVLPNVIQTSAAINPGNSGGALVDLSGNVVGIPTLAANDPQIGGAAPGIGFAIPSSVANDIATQLIQHGHVVNSHRAFLGVQTSDTYGGRGVYVVGVVSGGPADGAGIARGDLITAIGGTATPSNQALSEILAQHAPGDRVELSVVDSNGKEARVSVTLGELPG